MKGPDCAVIGGGAAGFFGAIACAAAAGERRVRLCEALARPLIKVGISGGGRCNVTHACFDPDRLVGYYPRGARELLGPFHRWQPRDTMDWFAEHGVALKTEVDGRVFPVTDDSATVIDCLLAAADSAGVRWQTGATVREVEHLAGPGLAKGGLAFHLHLTGGESFSADRVLLATGGGKGSAGLAIARSLGHAIEPPVPSLFSFHIDDSRIRGLSGVSVADAAVRAGAELEARGPILITHWGVSGPAILKLSAWGARELAACNYRFALTVAWVGGRSREEIRSELNRTRREHPRRRIRAWNPFALPIRLWDRLAAAAGILDGDLWGMLANAQAEALAAQLMDGEFAVVGKSMNKEEFVTCGGVRLSEVDFKTMESKVCPGLFLAGEVLDIDGLTGGFNLQAAWTTGVLAGLGMSGAVR